MRAVSLLPSATEIVYALGLDEHLVGVTFECDEPARARLDKAVVVGGMDTAGRTPGEIDAEVRARVAAGADLYHLHEDALRDLAPDLVLTQDLCRVCALPAASVDDALGQLGCSADVVTLDPYTLDEVLDSIASVASAFGAPERGTALLQQLRQRLDAVAAAVAGRPRPRVALLEWVDPPFAAGHWLPDLVEAAGGEPVAALPHRRARPTTWSAVADAAPDVVVVSPCGFGLD
ncbi:MAG: ABC transporter substrate-binding protein, partial [Jatrophihabitans sp.]|uniref:ABC transporter substrate-binding protein n=1 Tax=Jatrophihabitans sp. TaxID=1932789 RepID=UPI003F7D9F1B